MGYSKVIIQTMDSRSQTVALAALALTCLGTLACGNASADNTRPTASPAAGATSSKPAETPADSTVTLNESQLRSITIARVSERDFPVERRAVGHIDFNQNRTVSVYTPYAGRIVATFADLGDEVKKGQRLFTLESPDFISAQSNLISTAATFEQTTSALARAKALYEKKAIDQNDYESALANQHSAEGALRAARSSVAIFGKSAAQIEHIEKSRNVEHNLIVKSPIAGRVTARSAAPGLYLQPGNPPAPFTVADLSSVWLVAEVPEDESAGFKAGQRMSVTVAAYPQRIFTGKVNALGASIDPNSRRLMLRSEIKDPRHELLPEMFANFVIAVGPPERAPAVPVNGVVREGDGTMSIWVVGSDPHRFTRRSVTIGLTHDGYDEVREGLRANETVVVDGAIFLSNILYGGAT